MVQIKNSGALTVARKTKKNGNTRGTMSKNNLEEALQKGHNNIIFNQQMK